ncbi:tellurite resistance TerB family protein [Salipiger sp. PrR002]|uniref:tellurite resistance TerB family protein n=1 Tax=Salipiger sp. PrR002 TaxID=2706489 RepID=UPI0013B9AB47|nr:tellurite resistance TerB family protein [Salipiger sp. PrR002]NDW01144.1 tellurite resistance TerB family protein [Salipiger sp. PrR002]NDW57947.1 tellurite resistance TerB family protein [Salipiger sp. PrR004]
MDVNKLLEGFLGAKGGAGTGMGAPGKATGSGLPSGLIGGAAAGGLIALLAGSKKGRKLGGKAIKYGGLAAVGGLAYKAYSDWQAQKTSGTEPDPLGLPKPSPESGFDPENDRDARGDDFRLVLMRAMISAAQSDNHIDQDEHGRIREQVAAFDLGPNEKAALYDYFSEPADPATIAGLARTEAQKAEIYLASALCIDPDTPDEEQYMRALATELRLPDGLRGHLDAEAAAARQQMA